ncbi:hypothetical protein KSP40_PGU009059 [Platanthera guangdongensis]|uniref:Glycosyl transferase 64 domain-containing protein n=1 Tax=Platanthera guangdongensis TaxID=2320717 RepID=A0ABR2MHN6_9ASPA
MRIGNHGLCRRLPDQKFRMAAAAANPLMSVSKMKAFIFLCIGLTAFLIAATATAFFAILALHHLHRPMASSIVPASAPAAWKGYTILINTWKRNDLLRESVLHYSRCDRVESIRIVWSEPDPPSHSLRHALSEAVDLNSKVGGNVELVFDLNQEDSLNNRFKDIEDLKSDAVFSVDDDVIFPCESVHLAFTVWRSAPETMVGFVPRMHWLNSPLQKSNGDHYFYGKWWSVWWTGTYSMVLSKAAFLHKKYLHLYTNQMPQSIRTYVTQNRNCEDIAMAFLVANETGAPPIWVKGRIREIGSTGISSLGSHGGTRTRCINDFAAVYGHMPLVLTNVKAVDGRSSWLW